jgi:hypothetical protein
MWRIREILYIYIWKTLKLGATVIVYGLLTPNFNTFLT